MANINGLPSGNPVKTIPPLDVKTLFSFIKKRFVELHVLMLPLGSFIIPSS